MQNEPEGKETYRSLLRKVLEGNRSRKKLGEGTGSVKKYLASTIGRGLVIRSSMRRKKLAVQ
jgi:hypothetical protein